MTAPSRCLLPPAAEEIAASPATRAGIKQGQAPVAPKEALIATCASPAGADAQSGLCTCICLVGDPRSEVSGVHIAETAV